MTFPHPYMAHKIMTHSGRLLDLQDPQPEDILIEDIAHGLSRQYRYGGALRDYTVAQHCVVVTKCVYDNWPGEPHQGLNEALRLALMHDASEAFIRDMPTPAKRLLPDYVDLEHKLMQAVFNKFGIASTWVDMIKDADSSACGAEARIFIGPTQHNLDDLFPLVILPIDTGLLESDWAPDRSKAMFLRLWEGLQDPEFKVSNVGWKQNVKA
jgi:hypothetical protein